MRRPEAEQYKTPLNDQLYLLQTEYMRQEAAKMLQVRCRGLGKA